MKGGLATRWWNVRMQTPRELRGKGHLTQLTPVAMIYRIQTTLP